MPSTYSPSLRLELIGSGEQSGTWGTTTNTNLGTLLEQSIVGVQAITMVNANYTLSNFNGASDEARKAILVVSGTNAAIRDIIAPLVAKTYTIKNNTTGGFSINIRAATGASVTIPNGATYLVYCDGTNFNLSLSQTVVAAGTGISVATVGITNTVSFGPITSAQLATALTDETGSGASVFATSPTLVTPILGTPAAGSILTNCTGLPIATGVSGLGTGVATFLATPTSANLAAAVTNETGSGSLVFSVNPTFTGAVTISGASALRGSYGAGAVTSNFAAGDGALVNNTVTGAGNVAVGYQALNLNTNGAGNVAVGANALGANTTGSSNSASGNGALAANTTGTQNAAMGASALGANTTGTQNAAMGAGALAANTTGIGNAAVGGRALISNTTGAYNTAVGYYALYQNTTGSGNVQMGGTLTTGFPSPVFNITTESNRVVMGSTAVTNAYVKVAWTITSDARDKTNFAPVPHGLDFVTKLQPTAYQFKEDRETDVATGCVRYGFKAQDILALEGDASVIIDNDDLNHLRINSDSLIPVLVNAIKELTTRLEALEGKSN